MSLNLDEIEKALGEATPGKWGMDDEDGYAQWSVWVGPRIICKMNGDNAETESNAHLIANAPEWLRLLVERVRKLESVMYEHAMEHGTHGFCDCSICKAAKEHPNA